MSNDTKWLVGTAVVLAGLLSAQIAGVNARVDDLRTDLTTQIAGVNARVEDVRTDLTARVEDVRTDLTARVEDVRTDLTARMDRIETRLDGIDERLRNVEIAFGRVDQRLLTLERIILPAPDQPDR